MLTNNYLLKNKAVWVVNPETGTEVNVGPFLEMINLMDSSVCAQELGSGALKIIRQIMRTLNLIPFDPNIQTPGQLVGIYTDLHMMEEMFEIMQKSRPAS